MGRWGGREDGEGVDWGGGNPGPREVFVALLICSHEVHVME